MEIERKLLNKEDCARVRLSHHKHVNWPERLQTNANNADGFEDATRNCGRHRFCDRNLLNRRAHSKFSKSITLRKIDVAQERLSAKKTWFLVFSEIYLSDWHLPPELCGLIETEIPHFHQLFLNCIIGDLGGVMRKGRK